MADYERGPSLISKYVWVIETINRRRKISFKELNEIWVRDVDISRGIEIPKRTFDNWRYAIADMFGIDISNENCGEYRYYIENADELRHNGLRSWLYNTFCVSNALANSQSIKDRILLEYVPSGQPYLKTIVEAMKQNRVLNMTYHSYWKDEEKNYDVQPYCLSWNAAKFFNGCFGIIATQSIDIQPVKLKVSASQANYIRDLKMHESQNEIERNDEYSIFSLNLRPEYDFQQELLWNGEDMEVLEPLWLRKEIAGKIKRMWNKYSASENKDKLV